MPRYHVDLGLPEGLALPRCHVLLVPSKHAQHEAQQDNFDLPATLDTTRAALFEVVTNDAGRIEKLGYRVPIEADDGGEATWDCCLIVRPARSAWAVVTAWANRRDDQHRTLRREAYTLPC